MKSLSPTQQACLDAMGIDVWVSRGLIAEESEIRTTTLLDKPETTLSKVVEKVEDNIPTQKQTVADSTLIVEEKIDNNSITLNVPKDWAGLIESVSVCQACALHSSRTQTVFGEGNQQADWLIIGDAPSEEEDQSGTPFRGEQGQLLTAMLRAIGLSRQQVYITNVIKCKTPNNRDADSLETDNCIQYLKQQISLIQPKIILVVGQNAAQQLLNNHSTLARLRQKVHTLEDFNIPVVVTYHPASLLSLPTNKRDAWHDLLFAQKTISAEAVL